MKKFFAFLLFVIAATLSRAESVAASPADEAWATIGKLQRESPPGDPHTMPKRDLMRWNDEHAQRVARAGWAFYTGFPEDPRRWDIAYGMLRLRAKFITGFAADYETSGLVTVDEQAGAAWKKKVAELQAAIDSAPDLPSSVRVLIDGEKISKLTQQLPENDSAPRAASLASLHAEVLAYAARYPNERAVSMYVMPYLFALESAPAAERDRLLADLAASSNATLAKGAGSRFRAGVLMRKPFEMKFTALDGRAVDVSALRGKVVLIDFWATWCVPCVAELPNVKKVYAEYHDKGFEVVGISLDRVNDRKKLTDFVRDHDLPWPQFFDGKAWKTEFAEQYAIGAIPAMFLLDQEGIVVSTNARGEKLEAEVKRLLKL